MLDKKALRQQMLQRREVLSANEMNTAGGEISNHLQPILENDIVALYQPIKGEVPTTFIAKKLLQQKITIVLPHIDTDNTMHFRKWSGTTTVDDALGIPSGDGEVLTPTTIFVPLLAFNREGYRLGYGKGFYDKTLASLPSIHTIGLAYSWQEVAELPIALHDIPLWEIWTEKEIIKCQNK